MLADALPLILLPGTLCDERVFAPLQERLPSIATQVALTTEAESLAEAAEQVLAGAPAQFALLGFSLGGLVAMEIALRAPGRVQGLALLSTTPFAVDPAQHAARRQAVAEAQRSGMGPFLRHHLWPSYTGVSEDTECLTLLEGMATSLGPAVFDRQTEMALGRQDVRPQLCNLRCPTLVLAGEADRLCPPPAQRALAAAVPCGVLRLVRDAGHFLLLERPDETAASVAAWFNTLQQ